MSRLARCFVLAMSASALVTSPVLRAEAQTPAAPVQPAPARPPDAQPAPAQAPAAQPPDAQPAPAQPSAAQAAAAQPPPAEVPPAPRAPEPAGALASPVDSQGPSALVRRIKVARELAAALTEKVWQLEAKHTVTPGQARGHKDQISSWVSMLEAFDERARGLVRLEQSAVAADQTRALSDALNLGRQVAAAESGLAAIEAQLGEAESATGWNLVGTILEARCRTAICFDNGSKKNWLGIEPLVELPVGKSFALSESSLANYVDNHEIRVDLAAGARVWFFRDIVSLSIYISKPLTDDRIRLEGSPFVYSASSMRRPYPGVALGLFFDSLWFGFDRDELRNGDGQDAMSLNPDFPPNAVVSSTWTLTVALQPVTAFRTAIGTAVQASEAPKP